MDRCQSPVRSSSLCGMVRARYQSLMGRAPNESAVPATARPATIASRQGRVCQPFLAGVPIDEPFERWS